MTADINKWVSECEVCQSAGYKIKDTIEHTPIKVSHPFELIGMDLIGKLKTTKNGYQYICVMTDYYTKWTQAYPITSKTAEEVTTQILKFVFQFEAPKRILTDQGTEFVNSINKNVCEKVGIKRSLCAPYHPQTNGLVERMNATIQRSLCKLVGSKPETWDEYLDAVMFGLRTKKQMTTKFSPFFLMFGREARYPFEIPEKYEINNTVEQVMEEETVTECIKHLDAIKEVIEANVTRSTTMTKKRLRSASRNVSFSVGELVLRQNVRSQQRKGGKLEPNFLGPFKISALQGKSADLISENGALFKNISIDHLKHFKPENPRIPHKMTTQKTENPTSAPPAPPTTSPPAPPTTSPPAPPTTSPPASPPAPPTTSPPASPPAPLITSPPAPPTTSPPAPPTTSPPAPPTTSPPASPPAPPTTSPPASPPAPPTTSPPASPPAPLITSPPVPPTTSPPASPPVPPTTFATVLPTTMSDTISTVLNKVWGGTHKDTYVLLSKIGPYKLFSSDFARICPGQELESEVINAYLHLMVNNYNRNHQEKARIIDSFEMSRIWLKKSSRLKIDPEKFKIIVGIVNESHHWMLVVIYPLEKRTVFLNSLGESQKDVKRCLEATRAFMRSKGMKVSRWKCETVTHAIQQDMVSCGVFALKFAECILENKDLNFPSTAEAVKTNLDISSTLLSESESVENLCRHCGSEDKDHLWIACDRCNWWYHQDCINFKQTNTDYCCEMCL
ncbi:uncharacterized protein LOC116730540 [Xiphophorus hellerii]|uniref:uncharacterized protein LOC116730540 n=1 Tax=Xiphophorus hellerii TaxID=8084 RepID=UPI0013B420DC|nr:uncharacterized protein LOC116730540 [Xiphophorus hellerii]